MTTRRRKRDPFTRTVVRLPEQDLAESILALAAPLLESLGGMLVPDDVRSAVALTISLWNARVEASGFFGDPRPKPLADLRTAMCGKKASSGQVATFELLSKRWRKEFAFDPRLVGEWSLDVSDDGQTQLVCETILPDGVEAEVLPSVEERIAIGGRFLDDVRIPLSPNSYLKFSVKQHWGDVSSDGSATVYTEMPTALALFAEGLLQPVGGSTVDIVVAGKQLGPMVLAEVRCVKNGGWYDIAKLVFMPVKI